MSKPSPWLLPMTFALAILLALAWWLPNRPQPAGPPVAGGKLNSLSFAPYRDGQSPLRGIFPTAAQVEADIALLAPHVHTIRTYAAIEGDYDVAALARKHGVKLWQGIWLGSDRAQNDREIARAIEQAHRYPDTITRVVVGNEVLLRRDLPPEELIADIDRVRAAVAQPVTYADVWEFWEQFPQVADHVDIVTIHLLPYWEDHPTGIARAIAHVRATYRHIAALFPGKRIAVGETGWPSQGRWRADAAPGVVNQAVFVRDFVAMARAEGIDYNLIEAFDQGWKYQSEGTVGANWGLWTAARQPKFPLSGPVTEDPGWPRWPISGALAGIVLMFAGLTVPRLPETAQGVLVLLAMSLGGALAYAASTTLPVIYDAWQATAAAGNLAGQALLAALLMRRTARMLAGHPPPPARTGADATAAIRALLLFRRTRLVGWRAWLFDDLGFLFLWTATLLQLLLLFDPRYRDFPLGAFAVPLVAIAARAMLRDLPVGGGGREEAFLAATLAFSAIAGALAEGAQNTQSLIWSAAALVLTVPPLLRLCSATRRRLA